MPDGRRSRTTEAGADGQGEGVITPIDGEVDVCSLGSGQPDGSQRRRVGQTDQPDALRKTCPHELDRGFEIRHIELERISSSAWQDDQSRGVHTSTMRRGPKREQGRRRGRTLKACSMTRGWVPDPIADAGFRGDQPLDRAGGVGSGELPP